MGHSDGCVGSRGGGDMQGHESWGVPQLSPWGALRGWALRHLEAGLGYRQGTTHPCGPQLIAARFGEQVGLERGTSVPPCKPPKSTLYTFITSHRFAVLLKRQGRTPLCQSGILIFTGKCCGAAEFASCPHSNPRGPLAFITETDVSRRLGHMGGGG